MKVNKTNIGGFKFLVEMKRKLNFPMFKGYQIPFAEMFKFSLIKLLIEIKFPKYFNFLPHQNYIDDNLSNELLLKEKHILLFHPHYLTSETASAAQQP